MIAEGTGLAPLLGSVLDRGAWGPAALRAAGGLAAGALLGLLAGILVHVLLRRRGAYAWEGRGAAWIRRGGLVLALGTGCVGGAALGLMEGGLRALRHGIATAPARTSLEEVGSLGADALLELHRALETEAPPAAGPGLPVARFLANLDRAADRIAESQVPALAQGLAARQPRLASLLGEAGVRALSRELTHRLLVALVERPLQDRGLDVELAGLRGSLLEEARLRGGVLGRPELGGWVRRRVLEPALLRPATRLVRGHQLLAALLLLAAWALPPAALAWARRRRARTAAA